MSTTILRRFLSLKFILKCSRANQNSSRKLYDTFLKIFKTLIYFLKKIKFDLKNYHLMKVDIKMIIFLQIYDSITEINDPKLSGKIKKLSGMRDRTIPVV
jgi:hypothetical protein